MADAQPLRMPAVVTPWSPVMIEATDPVRDGRAFVADVRVASIESQPTPPPMPKSRRAPGPPLSPPHRR